MLLHTLIAFSATTGCPGGVAPPEPPRALESLHVDPARGKDRNPGTIGRPLRSISAALAKLVEPLTESVTLELAPGNYTSTGGAGMPEGSLHLSLRMRPGVTVTLRGKADDKKAPVFAWEGGRYLVEVRDGSWRLSDLQVGSGSKAQRGGIRVRGPSEVDLENVEFQLRSHSGAGLLAERGGRATLRGSIAMNPQFHEKAEEESFCGILATDHGVVEFAEREGASLSIGNGTLSVRTYGRIRLGCENAEITCWTTSNNLGVNNGGRIDLANTPTILVGKDPRNTLIGLEHDGHILAEDTHVYLRGKNHSAIALQKASTFTCNDVHLEGEFETTLWASSGSMFVGSFHGEITRLDANTGAGIHLERLHGEFKGKPRARAAGVITLPDRTIREK